MTNFPDISVGATVTTTNTDGSVTHLTKVSETVHDYRDFALWFTVV
jgi:hypothetical protein